MFRFSILHHHQSSSSSLFSSTAALLASHYSGTVKQWNSSGSYGFIIDDETRKSLFVPMRELVFLNPNETKRSLWMHQRVQFDKALDQQSRRGGYTTICVNVRDAHGKPLPPGPVVTSALSTIVGKNSGISPGSANDLLLTNNNNIASVNSSSSASASAADRLISAEKAKRILNRQALMESSTNINNGTVDPYFNLNNPIKIRENKALQLVGQRNLVGRIVSIEGAFGFIEGATEQIRNALGGPIFFTKKDIVHSTGRIEYLQMKKSQRKANHHVSMNNNNNSFPGSSFVNVGDQVFFDIAQDVKRAGKVKGVNVRKDMMAATHLHHLNQKNGGGVITSLANMAW